MLLGKQMSGIFFKLASAACPLFALPFLSSVASADVLFRGDFETGDLSQWDRTLNEVKNGRTNLTVVDSPVYGGNSAAKMVIHEDDRFNASIFRVEVHRDFDTTGEGKETFFSWFFMYPEPAKHNNLIGYWESDKSYDLSMDFRVANEDDGTTSIAFVSKEKTEHWKAPLSIGDWHQIAMHVKWSTSADKGRVSVWFDGNSVVDEAPVATKNDRNRLFMQIGLMRIRETGPVETIYIDEAIEATTLDEVLMKPMNPGSMSTGGMNAGGMSSGGSGGMNSGGTGGMNAGGINSGGSGGMNSGGSGGMDGVAGAMPATGGVGGTSNASAMAGGAGSPPMSGGAGGALNTSTASGAGGSSATAGPMVGQAGATLQPEVAPTPTDVAPTPAGGPAPRQTGGESAGGCSSVAQARTPTGMLGAGVLGLLGLGLLSGLRRLRGLA